MEIPNLPKELLLQIAENLSRTDLTLFVSTFPYLMPLLFPLFRKYRFQNADEPAFRRAIEHDDALTAEIAIARGVKINEKRKRKLCFNSPLYWAVFNGSTNVIRVFFRHGATIDGTGTGTGTEPRTPLLWAVSFGHAKVVRVLLELGAVIPLTYNDDDGGISMPTHLSARLGDVDCMKALIAGGFDFSTKGPSGKTVLHEAINAYGVEMTEYLLSQEGGRSIIDIRDFKGRTPLHYAVCCERNEEEKTRLLLYYGANTELENLDGYTPAALAQHREMDDLHIVFLECMESIPLDPWLWSALRAPMGEPVYI